jgi:hypothetical protein
MTWCRSTLAADIASGTYFAIAKEDCRRFPHRFHRDCQGVNKATVLTASGWGVRVQTTSTPPATMPLAVETLAR